MSEDWVKKTFESALLTIDNAELVHRAGQHVLVEGEFSDHKIRPSLLGSDCMLQTVKKFRGHQPQPYSPWMAARRGMPNANTNITFTRGFLGEGLVVGALKHYAEMTNEYEVVGCAPQLVFEWETTLDKVPGARHHISYQAHPDMLILRQGELELIQIKTPSVWAFERAEKGSSMSALEHYRLQMVTEMYIGRKMGMDIRRNHLLMFTWEGWRPGMDKGDEVRSIPIAMDWEPSMDALVENLADEVMRLNDAAGVGNWPKPANDESNYNKWPCSYCQYARTRQYDGQVICTEVEKWEREESESERLQRLTQSATS